MEKPGQILPRLHQLRGCPTRSHPRFPGGIRPRGRHLGGAVVRPWISSRGKGNHREKHPVGTLDPRSLDFRGTRFSHRDQVRRSGGATGRISDSVRSHRSAETGTAGRPHSYAPVEKSRNAAQVACHHQPQSRQQLRARRGLALHPLCGRQRGTLRYQKRSERVRQPCRGASDAAEISRLRKWIPQYQAPHAPGSAHRILEYKDGLPVWEGNAIRPSDPIPEMDE